MNCPCGSQAPYADCCRPVIKGERRAASPEQVMRARYTAYTQVEMDYLRESLHPDRRQGEDLESSRKWAAESEWLGLEIVAATEVAEEDTAGQVEFVALYRQEGQDHRYHEIADFEKVDGTWYFTEGQPGVRKPFVREEPRTGRNEPCPCGSGKKFKRCCGA